MSIPISIIMPVYNGELYVERAINSIISQSRKDWELIVVNDGSIDRTTEILNRFAQEDSRINIYHRENCGVAASRQFGIKMACGEYCIHVDSDDWLEPDFIEEFVRQAVETDSDLIWCDAFCNLSDLWCFELEQTPEAMIHSILKQEMWGVLWNKMIRTNLAKEWGIVPKEIAMWEDMAYIIPCLLHCKKVSYINKPLYHYNIENQESMVHKQQSKNMTVQYCLAVNHLEQQLLNSGRFEEFQKDMIGLKLFAIRDFIDDIRFRDYDKFMNTYPDAIKHIWEYKAYPNRLKVCAWLLSHDLNKIIPFICKFDSFLRKIGVSKQV